MVDKNAAQTAQTIQFTADVKFLLAVIDSFDEKPDMAKVAAKLDIKRDAARKRMERLLKRVQKSSEGSDTKAGKAMGPPKASKSTPIEIADDDDGTVKSAKGGNKRKAGDSSPSEEVSKKKRKPDISKTEFEEDNTDKLEDVGAQLEEEAV